MSASARAKRMKRHHARKRPAALSLVSLMDIFTILVFFLLVNSAEVQTLEPPKAVTLPESLAVEKPRETVVVMVTPEQVLVQGAPVASIAEVAVVMPLDEVAFACETAPVDVACDAGGTSSKSGFSRY